MAIVSAGDHSDLQVDVSQQLRSRVVATMDKYPDVRLEDGLSLVQWEKQRQDI